ncbi:hypothetical protein [Bacillus cereus]|uniref:hypothetical protein n=1 Tax=Bacillus cereus TaxID=1396 RepID=UPI000BED11FD|nr:hypothetical protein [Bacillus cereus]PEF60670.1 hypothetical protein CON35_29605 [Bacillus cereus]
MGIIKPVFVATASSNSSDTQLTGLVTAGMVGVTVTSIPITAMTDITGATIGATSYLQVPGFITIGLTGNAEVLVNGVQQTTLNFTIPAPGATLQINDPLIVGTPVNFNVTSTTSTVTISS